MPVFKTVLGGVFSSDVIQGVMSNDVVLFAGIVMTAVGKPPPAGCEMVTVAGEAKAVMYRCMGRSKSSVGVCDMSGQTNQNCVSSCPFEQRNVQQTASVRKIDFFIGYSISNT